MTQYMIQVRGVRTYANGGADLDRVVRELIEKRGAAKHEIEVTIV